MGARNEGVKMSADGNSSPQITPEQKEACEKVVKFGLKSATTVVALAGAGVVSVCKLDSKPLSKTFDWCKEHLWSD